LHQECLFAYVFSDGSVSQTTTPES